MLTPADAKFLAYAAFLADQAHVGCPACLAGDGRMRRLIQLGSVTGQITWT